MWLGSAPAVASRFAPHLIHPQVGALPPPTYFKGWPSTVPPLLLFPRGGPSCLSSFLTQNGIFGMARGHTPTGPPENVFQRPVVLETSLGGGGPPSPLPPSKASSSPPYRLPIAGPSGHLYQGAWVVGGYHPLQCRGAHPSLTPWLGHRHCSQFQLLSAPLPNRGGS